MSGGGRDTSPRQERGESIPPGRGAERFELLPSNVPKMLFTWFRNFFGTLYFTKLNIPNWRFFKFTSFSISYEMK